MMEALKDYVPEHLFLNKKQSFSNNLSTLLNNDLKEEVQDIFKRTDLFPYNTLDLFVIRNRLDRYYKMKNENPWSIWIIYAL